MNRKNFISTILPLVVAGNAATAAVAADDPEALIKIPPYLKKGDVIGITCPAGFISMEDVMPAVSRMQEWGFAVKMGNTVGKKDFTFGGTDEERLNDFQQMLDDKEVKAIMCARGGYGAVRITDKIDFRKFAVSPKWVIGFSDITVLHAHIHKNFGVATIHSKMCNSFPSDWSKADAVQTDTIESIKKSLYGDIMEYSATANEKNKPGSAMGILVGGNLKTIESLAGSKSDISTDGKILFVEDTGEYLYSIDRMFWNLKRSGKLSRLKGLIVGGFKIKAADTPDDEFGKSLQDIVLEKIQEYNYPVCFDFPVGHQKNNYALKCGSRHLLTVTAAGSSLKETR
ncbi:MAG: LD-carboxypeptidase [Ferruginibacter sp.]